MQTQTLKKRATNQKEKLQELAELAYKPSEDCGRDSEFAVVPQSTDPVNWNKGWGKYGKT